MDIGIEIRTNVLVNALMVENMISIFLAKLLGISNVEESKTLGNRSGNLSFNQKVDLLIDIGALSKEEKKKFQSFMEVRNQFMHNMTAKTYEKCFSFLDGREAYLMKLYKPDKTLTKEEQLEYVTKELGGDVLALTTGLMKKVKEKIETEVKTKVYQDVQQAILKSIETVANELDEFFEREIQKGTKFNAVKFKSFGTEFKKIIFRATKKELDKVKSQSKLD